MFPLVIVGVADCSLLTKLRQQHMLNELIQDQIQHGKMINFEKISMGMYYLVY